MAVSKYDDDDYHVFTVVDDAYDSMSVFVDTDSAYQGGLVVDTMGSMIRLSPSDVHELIEALKPYSS